MSMQQRDPQVGCILLLVFIGAWCFGTLLDLRLFGPLAAAIFFVGFPPLALYIWQQGRQ